MKTIFISDMHGQSPAFIVQREMKESGIEKAVFLGDYDTPEVLREIRKLRLKKVFVVGNHDYHYMFGYGVSSDMMQASADDYAQLWKRNPRERDFILNAIKRWTKSSGVIVEDKFNGEKAVYAHASLVDIDSCDRDVPDYVWNRIIRSNESMLLNFLRMKEKNYRFFFRGHDHYNVVFSSYDGNLGGSLSSSADRQILETEKRHIISVGSFYYGDYALFDDRTGELEFRNIADRVKEE